MPRFVLQHAKLFEADVTSTVQLAYFKVEDFSEYQHTTRLPGGFFTAQVVIPSTEEEYWQWRTERLLARLRIEEGGGKVIWEGRLEDVELRDQFFVALKFFGYWSNLTDNVRNSNYATAGNVIISDLVVTQMDSDTRQLSTSTANLATGPTVDQDYQDDWTMWRILTDPRRGVTSFGSTNDNPIDLAVWEDREVYYTERNPSAVTWQAFIRPGGGVDALRPRISWRTVGNSVAVAYESGGTGTHTGTTENAASIAKYIQRDYYVPNIGTSTSGPAEQRRDTELTKRKDPQQETDGITLSRIWDTNGVEFPLCRVRAGDVLRIMDFTPKTGDLGTVTLDAYRTFFIEETTCNHVNGQLRIRPDRSSGSIVDTMIEHGIT